MTFILDMSSGKQYPCEESSCPNQGTENTLQPEFASDEAYPTLQLTTLEPTAPAKQAADAIPGFAIDSLLHLIDD